MLPHHPSGDKTARVWDLSTGRQVAVFDKHRRRVAGVDWSPDGRSLAVGCGDGELRIYRAHHSMLDEQPNPYNKAVPILVQIDGMIKPVEIPVTKGDVVEVKDPNDRMPIKVTIDLDNKQVTLRKEGFKPDTESFKLDSYEGRLVRVWFEPLADATKSAADNSSADDSSYEPEKPWHGWPADAADPATAPIDGHQKATAPNKYNVMKN